jgi:hypothetical protein
MVVRSLTYRSPVVCGEVFGEICGFHGRIVVATIAVGFALFVFFFVGASGFFVEIDNFLKKFS